MTKGAAKAVAREAGFDTLNEFIAHATELHYRREYEWAYKFFHNRPPIVDWDELTEEQRQNVLQKVREHHWNRTLREEGLLYDQQT